MEVNLLLLDEGILEGEPGVYGLTDKGREYAGERYVETGPRSGYDLTTYDPKIIDDLDTSRERLQEQLAELITGGELLVYSGVGHTPRWEDPSRFAGDVAGLVERAGRG